MFADIPDVEHGFIFKRVQRVSLEPHSEGFTFLFSAIGLVQAHAPLSGSFGDGIILGVCVACFAHWFSWVPGILTLRVN